MWAGMASAAKALWQLERGYCRAEAHVAATHGDANGAVGLSTGGIAGAEGGERGANAGAGGEVYD